MSTAAEKAPSARASTLWIPIIVGSALMMQMLDASIIANALPAMAISLHASPISLNLTITIYMLASAIFLPISAWVADRVGARNVLIWSIIGFAVSSALCAAAHNLPELVAARFLQGAAGGFMAPIGRLVVLRSTPRSELIGALTIYTVPGIIGPIIGPPLGGLIIEVASWHWIFLINLPIALVGVYFALRVIPNTRDETLAKFDWTGFGLTGFGCAGLLFGFDNLVNGVLPLPAAIALIIAGALALLAFAVHAQRTADPLLDLSLFKQRAFYASFVGGGVMRLGMGASSFLTALQLQLAFGMSALEAGSITVCAAMGALVMRGLGPPILRRFGFRDVLVVNCVLSSATLAYMALFTPATPPWVIAALMVPSGLLRSLQFNALNSVAFAESTQEQLGPASTLSTMGQQLFQTIGVGLSAVMLNFMLHATGRETPDMTTLTPVFVATGLISLAGLYFFLPLAPNTGAEISGQRPAAELD